MKPICAILALWNGLLFLLLCVVYTPILRMFEFSSFGYGWHDWHGFVVPHLIVLCGLSVGFTAVSLRPKPKGVPRFLLFLQGMTVVTYAWAMHKWPGGDDGGGLMWMLFVGAFTAVPLLIAMCAIWVMLLLRLRVDGSVQWVWSGGTVIFTLFTLWFSYEAALPLFGYGTVFR